MLCGRLSSGGHSGTSGPVSSNGTKRIERAILADVSRALQSGLEAQVSVLQSLRGSGGGELPADYAVHGKWKDPICRRGRPISSESVREEMDHQTELPRTGSVFRRGRTSDRAESLNRSGT